MGDLERVLNYLKERFGIEPEVFREYSLIVSGDVWVTTREAESLPLRTWKRKGIRLARILKKGIKFTTAGMQVFGKYATKNIVNLEREEDAIRFMRGEDLTYTRDDVEEGQVIVKFGEDILGSGLLRNGKLKNQIPKGRRIVG
jgi:NOL1/NOP2/fmu family ribosome biogenesis protein